MGHKTSEKKPQAKVFAILARQGGSGVLFRRGPSKQVLLIKWNLRNDTFELGRWLKARIYERRCDLSPDGKKLIYFAANYKQPFFSWTAISNPPYLTALALWPKGDGWGGGGLFESGNCILLNHRPGEDKLAKGFKLPVELKVKLLGSHPGWGEDNPIYHTRLLRDGWELKQEGESTAPDWGAETVWRYKSPMIYQKTQPSEDVPFSLQMQIKGINKRNDSWYVIDHEVFNHKNEMVVSLPKTDWADWDKNGDLLYSRNGKLFRYARVLGKQEVWLGPAKKLVDFSEMKFEPRKAPEGLEKW